MHPVRTVWVDLDLPGLCSSNPLRRAMLPCRGRGRSVSGLRSLIKVLHLTDLLTHRLTEMRGCQMISLWSQATGMDRHVHGHFFK